MIIGERNLIIGNKNDEINNYSISIYVHFFFYVFYIIKNYIKQYFLINPTSNSPPLNKSN